MMHQAANGLLQHADKTLHLRKMMAPKGMYGLPTGLCTGVLSSAVVFVL